MKKILLIIFLFLSAYVIAADKVVQVGSTDVTLQIPFYDATNGSPYTEFADLNDLDIWYIRVETDEDVILSGKQDMLVLPTLTAAHQNDSIREIGHGYYRVDFNDAVFAAGATTASVIIEDANNSYTYPVQIDFQLVDYDPYTTLTQIISDVNRTEGKIDSIYSDTNDIRKDLTTTAETINNLWLNDGEGGFE